LEVTRGAEARPILALPAPVIFILAGGGCWGRVGGVTARVLIDGSSEMVVDCALPAGMAGVPGFRGAGAVAAAVGQRHGAGGG